MRFFSDRELENYVQQRITHALEESDRAHSERESFEKSQHEWEVRRLTARCEDVERENERFRGGYKRALAKLKKLRVSLADANRQLLAGGLTVETDEKTGRPKVTPQQEILDEAMTLVPGMDDLSQQHVRTYVDRELRKGRSKEEVLESVLEGGYADEG